MDKQDFFPNEPISKAVHNSRDPRPWLVFVILVGLGLADEVGLGVLLGYWESSGGVLGVVDNFPHIIKAAVVLPGVWAYFVWIPTAGAKVLADLSKNEVLDRDAKKNLTTVSKRTSKFLASKRIILFVVPLSIVMTASNIYINLNYSPPPWSAFVRWHLWAVRATGGFLTNYAFVYSVLWSSVVAYVLYRTFDKSALAVNPYHHDRAGGLRLVGTLTLRISRLPVLLSIYLVSEVLIAATYGRSILAHYNLIAEAIAAPILTLLAFVLPIATCRKAMIKAKEGELSRISEKINALKNRLLEAKSPKSEDVQNLTAVIELQSKIRKDFPTVPFDLSIVRRFSLNFLVSAIPAIVGFGADIFQIIGRQTD